MSDSPHPALYFLEAAEGILQAEDEFGAFHELDEILPHYPVLLAMLVDWAGSPGAEATPHLDTFRALLHHGLHKLRIELRQQNGEAREFWDLLQGMLEEALESGDNPIACHGLLDALATLNFPMPESLIEKGAAWLFAHHSGAEGDLADMPEAPEQMFGEVFDQPGLQATDIFELLKPQLQYLPAEVLDPVCAGMLQSDNSALRDGLLLCLLHPRALVRERLLGQLAQLEKPIEARQLHRLVMLRNWLPPAQAQLVDEVVRRQRRFNIATSERSAQGSTRYWASASDGSGATAVIMCRERTGRYQLSGAILKERAGVVDCWQSPRINKREADANLKMIQKQLPPSLPVGREYLQQLLPHFLALNVQSGELPEPELLEWLEALGGDLWQPQPLDIDGWLRQAEAQLQNLDRHRAFTLLAAWFEKHEQQLPWFENDPATLEIAEEFILSEHDEDESVLEKLLAPHRRKWRDRLVLMAIWAQCNLNKRGPQWQGFALLAQAIDAGEPVEQLPILPLVAEHTLDLVAHQLREDERFAEDDEDWGDGDEWKDDAPDEHDFAGQTDLFADLPPTPAGGNRS